MTKQRRFTKEFEDEAVQLAETSGRTQREIAADLGVGLSALARWIGHRRGRRIEVPDEVPQADMAAEFTRLRRENGILRLEREILKRAIAFFARGGSRLRYRLPGRAASPWHPYLHVWQRKLLRQRHGRDLLQDHQVRACLAHRLPHPHRGRAGHCPLNRRLLQSRQAPLRARLHQPRTV